MEIVSLQECSVRDLEPVLVEEVQQWDSQLSWDYQPAQQLIRNFIRSHALPGYALRDETGRLVGYCFFVVDRPVAFVGSTYVANDSSSSSVYAALIGRTVDSLVARRFVERIESQVFPFNCRLEPIFETLGFRCLPRQFLLLSVDRMGSPEGEKEPSRFRLLPWNRRLFEACSEVIYDSYIGSSDTSICHDYRSRPGCSRFLYNLIKNPACGSFSPEDTRVALDDKGAVCGILLAAYIRRDTGMIPQISVRREYQGMGLGRRLLNSFFFAARKRGVRQVALSVTEANRRAIRLYQSMGFRPRKGFHAFVWDRQ